MGRSIVDIVNAHVAARKTQLPVFDGTSARIRAMLADPDSDLGAVERVIASDPVLASALLRVANSSFFGGLEKVTRTRDAILRIGIRKVSNVVTLVCQRDNYLVHDPTLKPLVAGLWRHAVACALGCDWLAKRLRRPDLAAEAFLAGLLHDIGKLFVLRVLDDLKAQRADFDAPEELVRSLLREMHAEQGARLLESWNIPDVYTRVVRDHHTEEVDERDVTMLLVRVVDQACNKLGYGIESGIESELTASAEAQALRLSDLVAAELEIQLEDAEELAA